MTALRTYLRNVIGLRATTQVGAERANAIIEEGKSKRIAFSAYGNSPYFRKHYSKGGENGRLNSHQNWKDGMIRPGLNIADWNSVTKKLMKGDINKEFIYLEIPYKIILDFLEVNHNNHPMKIPKQCTRGLQPVPKRSQRSPRSSQNGPKADQETCK